MSDFPTPEQVGVPAPVPAPVPTEPTQTAAQRLRAAVLGYEDIGSEVVSVPQWGGTQILVRGMSAGERNVLAMKAKSGEDESGKAVTDPNKFYPLIVIATATEPTTMEPVFLPSDAANIMAKSGGAIDLLATTALRLSGLDVDKGAKAVEAAVEEAGKTNSSAEGATAEATSN